MKKIKKFPAKPLDKLPEGFEYSDEAKQDLKKRAAAASKELKRRCKLDKGLAKRVQQLLLLADKVWQYDH